MNIYIRKMNLTNEILLVVIIMALALGLIKYLDMDRIWKVVFTSIVIVVGIIYFVNLLLSHKSGA